MHFHLPKPLHGWREFLGEVGIIVVGVLIALGAEQVVERIRWQREADHALHSIKDEIGNHYFTSSEAMIAAPCIDRQLVLLKERLFAAGPYRPAPIFDDPPQQYVFREPNRLWSDDIWRSVTTQGVPAHLDADMRQGLGRYYAQIGFARENNMASNILNYRLMVLGEALEPDSGTRARLVEEIEEARGRNRAAALYSSQLMRSAEALNLEPSKDEMKQALATSGTLQFCRAHGLPLGNDTDAY